MERRAPRVGALVVPVSYRSLTSEVAYLVADSGATALVHDDAAIVEPALPELTGLLGSWHADDESLWAGPATPPTDDYLGATVVTMNYTSGTTGRPKGIASGLRPSRRPSTRPTRSPRSGASSRSTSISCADRRTTPRRAPTPR